MNDLAGILRTRVARYVEKRWDWHAFPANEGYPELERAQMRYIGSGGSPKTDDTATLAAGAFSCSLIYQEPGRKASVHHHRIEELFFVHAGELTMTWQFGDETIDFVCGPGDAVLNPSGRPHGFRNDGPADCVMQIMVATAGPMLPTYTDHPADHPTSPLRPATGERAAAHRAEAELFVARAGVVAPRLEPVDGGLFGARPYVTDPGHGGAVIPSHFAFFVDSLARGARTPAYARPVEEAFMVVDGVLDLEVEEGGRTTVLRMGPRDLALVPPGTMRRLGNSDAAPVRFAAIVGEPAAATLGWRSAATAVA